MLFNDANKVATLDELRADRIVSAARSYFPGFSPSDSYLWNKVLAAEAWLERKLRTFFTPTVIIPNDADQVEIAALDAAGTRWEMEAPYDYSMNLFFDDRWAFTRTNYSPLISVESLEFVYPSPFQTVFTVPTSWIRFDRMPGEIRIVPTGAAFIGPLNAFTLSAMAGATTIPQVMRLRYTAGIQDAFTKWPDLVEMVKRMAVLMVVEDQLVPSSGSMSFDGFSRSMSFDPEKTRANMDKDIRSLMDRIHGIRMVVC
ncbi:MAG: hypothetical protein COX57_05725 [Alphaproteobacteria bacterium CG_4_10_14_0_2_um_filter_63_37]|nr:MAG: hypothetical protein COX57_05725 [Alphaproteobacteria bacterium CG_4_10_14_0_2_um_filter_63_37]